MGKGWNFIAKPPAGGGGGGIFLIQKLTDLSGISGGGEYVVQKYVSNPYLINKKKWDMWVYVMIHGI